MALKTINDLTGKATPASTDLVAIWDVAGGATKKSTLAQAVTAGGAVMLTANQTITGKNTIAPLTVGVPLTLTPPPNNGASLTLTLSAADNGAERGSCMLIGNNNNASTPAAGHIRFTSKNGTGYFVWVDNTGKLRIHTSVPLSGTDTAGTVVGAQS